MFLEGGLISKSPAGGDLMRDLFFKNVGCEFGKGNTVSKEQRADVRDSGWDVSERPFQR